MLEMPGAPGMVEALQVTIRKAENGYAVDVRYPPHMLFKGMPPQIQALFQAYQKMGEAEDPMKAMADAMSGFVKKAQQAPPKPLRKAHEEYVFTTLDQTMAFVRELYASAEA